MTALTHSIATVATAQIADACLRLNVAFRAAPVGIKFVAPPPAMIYGSAVPVQHFGSVDIFLEVLQSMPVEKSHGETSNLSSPTKTNILVIDNGGRTDEACVGDLIALEVKNAGMQAVVIWGLHRDTADLEEIGLPVFSFGAYPAGPRRLDPRTPDAFERARFGDFYVTKSDTVFIDRDGVLFIETAEVEKVFALATTIREREFLQSKAAIDGQSLREQFKFHEYLTKRAANEYYTFRMHLTGISKSIEE